MGLVIFAGLIIGTLFTLFVVPMFYTLISARELKHLPQVPMEGRTA
jgi:multidrug efflux pump